MRSISVADPPGAAPATSPSTSSPSTSSLSTDVLESELVGLAGHLAAAHCRWLQLLAEFDSREAWAGPGLRSCAHWLSWRVGMSLRTGFEQLRVAHALGALPAVTEAFAAGRISYSKVRAITRVATRDTEETLLALALDGTASHVERVVRHTRQASADPAEAEARRHLDWRWDDDGTLYLRGRLTAEQGARLLAALSEVTGPARDDECSAEHSSDGCPPRSAERPPTASLAARRADALLTLVTGDRCANTEVTLVVDAENATAVVPGGPAVPAATAERIGCTARVRALLRDRQGNPLYLGRARWLASRAQRAALRVRDQGRCQFPGCDQTRHLDAHHIVSWLCGGRTDLDNLLLLCDFHHRLVHEHGYRVHGSGTDLRFCRPDGRLIDPAGPATEGDLAEMLTSHSDLTITAETITPTWTGERLDITATLRALLPNVPDTAAAA